MRNQVGAQTKTADIPRSSFDLSHGLKTTFNASELIPILGLEVLPGDTINLRASLFGRMATPIKPILDNLYLETFFFFTPWRQVWPNFIKMMGEQEAPGDSIAYSVPQMSGVVAAGTSTIETYMGIPPGITPNDTPFSCLPFRCYNKIYNFWFRDENLMAPEVEETDDGPDGFGTYNMLFRRKRRDYLTSGLPFPQKGPDVTVSLGDRAQVMAQTIGGTDPAPGQTVSVELGTTGVFHQLDSGAAQVDISSTTTAGPVLYANLADATGISINDLRESIQIQRLLERDARGGTRYPEILRAHFQVSDPSLLVHQRPLFLGGGSTQINITPVQQTTATDALTPQGNLAAYGTVSGSGHGFTASFTEHGYITGIVNVRADLTYQQGLERYWSRQTRYDFYWPALSHLGEQAVLNKEIFVSGSPAIDDATFSYMPRYDEYRFKQSSITGDFSSAASSSLDVWHLAQDFAALPALNEAFIKDAVPMGRVTAVPSEPDFLLDIWFKIKAARPLPLYGTPGLMDHF